MDWTKKKPRTEGHWLYFNSDYLNDERGYSCVTHVRVERCSSGRLYARGNTFFCLLSKIEGWWCKLEWPPAAPPAGEGV